MAVASHTRGRDTACVPSLSRADEHDTTRHKKLRDIFVRLREVDRDRAPGSRGLRQRVERGFALAGGSLGLLVHKLRCNDMASRLSLKTVCVLDTKVRPC